MATPPASDRIRSFRDFAALVDALGDVVMVTNQSGTITYVNRRGLSLLSLTLGEVVGQDLDDFLSERSKSVSARWLAMPTDEIAGLIFELELKGPRTEATPLEVRSEVLRSPKGPVSRVFVGRSLPDLVRAQAPLTGRAIRGDLLKAREAVAQHLYQEAQLDASRRGRSPITTQALAWGLSEQDARLLVLVAEGRTNRDIADRLGISPETVKDRIAALMAATGARRRANLVARALSYGLIAPL